MCSKATAFEAEIDRYLFSGKFGTVEGFTRRVWHINVVASGVGESVEVTVLDVMYDLAGLRNGCTKWT